MPHVHLKMASPLLKLGRIFAEAFLALFARKRLQNHTQQ